MGVGLGGLELPRDFSPESRFVKTVFLREYFIETGDVEADVYDFLNILLNVAMIKGTVRGSQDELHITKYSCCYSSSTGEYYYKINDKLKINCIKMFDENLDSDKLINKGY